MSVLYSLSNYIMSNRQKIYISNNAKGEYKCLKPWVFTVLIKKINLQGILGCGIFIRIADGPLLWCARGTRR